MDAKVTAAVDTAVRQVVIPESTGEKIKEEVELAWSEVVSGKRKKPGIIPVTEVVKQQIQQKSLADERKTNLMLHNFPAEANRSDQAIFLDVVEVCGLKTTITKDDVVSVKRIGMNGAPRNGNVPAAQADKIPPIIISLTTETKKRQLLKALSIWREKQKNERDPNDTSPWKFVDHDYTREQREERNSLLSEARTKNEAEAEDSHFRFRVRGDPANLKIVKVDIRTGRWVE